MQTETLKQRLIRLSEKILEVKAVKIVIGEKKKPIDRPDVIIFHIDI
jgi:hypothetical protein